MAKSIQEQLNALKDKVGKDNKPYDPIEHNDKTRSDIAKFLTRSYVGIVVIVIIGIPLYNAHLPSGFSPLDLKDALLAVAGVFGGTYGFVIGHYFKTSKS